MGRRHSAIKKCTSGCRFHSLLTFPFINRVTAPFVSARWEAWGVDTSQIKMGIGATIGVWNDNIVLRRVGGLSSMAASFMMLSIISTYANETLIGGERNNERGLALFL